MKLGVGKIKITPECKVRLCGYATRTEAFAGVKEDIYIRVQIHEDKGNRIVFIYRSSRPCRWSGWSICSGSRR